MQNKKSKKKEVTPAFGPKDTGPKPLLGLLCLILGVYTAIALLNYDYTQNPIYRDPAAVSIVGPVGMWMGYQLFQVLGVASWIIPLAFVWACCMFFFSERHQVSVYRWLALIGLLALVALFANLIEKNFVFDGGKITSSDNNFPYGSGGLLGVYLYERFLHVTVGMAGALVVGIVLFVADVFYLFYDNLGKGIWRLSKRLTAFVFAQIKASAERREALRAKKKKALEEAAKRAKERDEALPPRKGAIRLDKSEGEDTKANAELFRPEKAPHPKDSDNVDFIEPDVPHEPLSLGSAKKSVRSAFNPMIKGVKVIASERVEKADLTLPQKKGDYVFPKMDMLMEPEDRPGSDSDEIHQETAEALVKTLGEFGVKVTPGEVHAGPVITRYDVYPAAGVRVEKIQNLDKNIALALKATSVRILAPVPGKGCVGIEVPNRHPQSVCIRDILESKAWVDNKAEIPIALGKEVSGKPLIADLTKMPHLLIAGSTGSGKTVCINSVITSLLYKLSPEEVRFVMVDPKIVEMQVFNDLPHMMIPVVTDPKKVPGALKYLLNEMDRRYQMFAAEGVRNIAGFNAKRSKDKDAEAKARELEMELSPEERAAAASVEVPRDDGVLDGVPDRLPYVVCIVDELADLMMVAPADIETGIARLAQLARAAGIHLILATQRPSVNVITGVIKANLPSRIAFKVASKVDSRTILDGQGADQLIGRGDMLFLPPGSADLVRSQGAFVADEEIANIVKFIHDNNGDPVFDEDFQRSVEEGDSENAGEGLDGNWDDEMVPKAIDVIKNTKRASTSMLQRRLRIGYNRAARIMEILEDEGIVGPENGSSPREILKDFD